ncbi:MAG: gluconokinase [Terriglobales bacterium]
MILILFGVCGAGKTTIGQMLAARLGWRFEDADDYHSEANRQKMRSGVPLSDADRLPWLQALNGRMLELARSAQNAILACSALKQEYRNLLVAGLSIEEVRFALLEAPRELLEQRIRERNHPYMNPSLLDSQLATLELPSQVWRISVSGTPAEAVDQVLHHLKCAGQA